MVVIISELEVVRMRMGRVLRLLLGDVVDFRIGDRVMVRAWLELEGGMILVAARRLSERERIARNESVLCGCRLREGLFASPGHGRIVGDLAARARTLGCVYRVVTRQIDRISVRSVHYEKRFHSSTREGTADIIRGTIRAGRQTRFVPGSRIRRCGGAGADRDRDCGDHGSLIIRSGLSPAAP